MKIGINYIDKSSFPFLMFFIFICLIATVMGEDNIKSKTSVITLELPNQVPLELVYVKNGSFLMGSPENENGRFPWEALHKVTIKDDYWISKYEITQKQYKALTGRNPSFFQSPENPVEQVSWHDALEFCRQLNEITKGKRPAGYEYSLPTEAQWEYACRAGRDSSLNSGENMDIIGLNNSQNLDKVGWYAGNCGQMLALPEKKTGIEAAIKNISNWQERQYPEDKWGGTHPVGQKQSNDFELYDMHGNVSEWTLDRMAYNNGKLSMETYRHDIVDPLGKTGDECIVRGGSWMDFARDCRAASRGFANPANRDLRIGFRVVLSKGNL